MEGLPQSTIDGDVVSGALPLYTFSTPSQQWSKQLQQVVSVPESMLCKSSMRDCFPFGDFSEETSSWNYEIQFYLGAAGTGSPVHFHGHALNTLAYGEKVLLRQC